MAKLRIPHDLLHNDKVTLEEAKAIAAARQAIEAEIDGEAAAEARAMRRINAFRPRRGKKYAAPGKGVQGR